MPVGVGELATLIGIVITVAREVLQLVETAQRNKEKCAVLKAQVESIKNLMQVLGTEWTPDQVIAGLLNSLDCALRDGRALVDSCQKKRTFSHVFKTNKKKNKFDALGVRISRILEQFNIANMILIVSINKERFFMNVLEKLLQHDACSLLPKNEKEELRTSIRNLTNMENMSAEAQRLLACMDNQGHQKRNMHGFLFHPLIHQDIYRGAASTGNSWAARPGGGGAEADEIVRLANSIAEEARVLRHNRKEIQQLVQFVQQVADIVRHPQASQLWRDPNSRTIVNNLREDLNRALRIVSQNEQHRGNYYRTRQAAFSCVYSFEQPDEILKAAYKIEYYVLVLPVIALRQLSSG